MSKSLNLLAAGTTLLAATALSLPALADGDAAKGKKVFKKCAACHAVGDKAKNKVGPILNDLMGRKAAAVPNYKYSKAMIAAGKDGWVWDTESLHTYLTKPKAAIKGTKMAFAGLRKDADIDNVIAYLAQFSAQSPDPDHTAGEQPAANTAAETPPPADTAASPEKSGTSPLREGGVYGLGRVATEDEIAAWDIDIRPDGQGLPAGSGSVADGEILFTENCAVCHGDFGEGVGRWPVLAGGQDSLREERPEKTIGSYWPYLSTVYDYVRRAMPFGNARSMSDDDVYALTAYLLYLNDLVDDDFTLSQENFTDIHLPNEENFIPDDRMKEAHYAKKGEPCMENCTAEQPAISMRARILDVTPDGGGDDAAAGAAVD